MRSRVGAAVGAGTYVGAVAAVALDAGSATVGYNPPPVAWIAVLIVAGLAAITGAVSVERFEPLRRDRLAATVGVVPLIGLGLALVVWLVSDRNSLGAGVLGAAVAVLGLYVLRRSAQHHHARRRAEPARRLATLPLLADRAPVRRIRAVNVALGALWLLFAAGAYLEDRAGSVLYLGLGLAFLVVALDVPTPPTIVDSGVLVESRFANRLAEWDAFDGYYLDGDELVLLRREWWQPDFRFDADEVDDEALAAIDDHLVRSKTRTVPASGVVPYGDDEAEVAG